MMMMMMMNILMMIGISDYYNFHDNV